MKIAFLCSSLEPGHDGVGDYTTLLAAECIRQGHACSLISLHDRHLRSTIEATSSSDGTSIPHLRLPATMPWPQRVREAREYRARFASDWISLQFVPYGFQPKGIVAGLAERVREIAGQEARRHIMFHELWIGQAQGAAWKDRLVGAIQRQIILQLIRAVRPDVITTSNSTYVTMLARHHVSSKILPLFGNIPIAEPGPDPFSNFVPASRNPGARSGLWYGVLFGALHPAWEAEPLFGTLLEAAGNAKKQVILVSMGRMSAAGELKWETLCRRYGDKIDFVNAGELPAPKISSLLQAADFGVATSPWELIGKSGAAAAMIDHGLPVIVNRDDWHLSPPASPEPGVPPQLYRLNSHLPALLASGLPKRPPQPRLPQIARDFLTKLQRPLG